MDAATYIVETNAAAYRNRAPILGVLRGLLPEEARVLEVGSGHGIHAVYAAEGLPRVIWQPTERRQYLAELAERCAEAGLANVLAPVALNLLEGGWPAGHFDAVVAVNVLHIAPKEAVPALFEGAAAALQRGGLVFVYGPFRYRSRTLEASNERFDAFLRARDPRGGLRTFEDVDAAARSSGFELVEDRALPANNRGLSWRLV